MYVSVSLLLGMNARMDQERVDFMIGYIVQLIRNKWLWLLFPPPFFFHLNTVIIICSNRLISSTSSLLLLQIANYVCYSNDTIQK